MKCIGCAACCHSTQTDYVEVLSGVDDVPERLTYYSGNQQYMQQINGHCIALDTLNGKCSIYDNRPTVCQQFKPKSRGCYAAIYRVFGGEYLELSLKEKL